jgi:hypothetical protein
VWVKPGISCFAGNGSPVAYLKKSDLSGGS